MAGPLTIRAVFAWPEWKAVGICQVVKDCGIPCISILMYCIMNKMTGESKRQEVS